MRIHFNIKLILRIAAIVLALAVISGAIAFVFRGAIARQAFHSLQQKMADKYNAAITANSLQFKGLKTLYIRHLQVQVNGQARLFVADEVSFSPRLLPLLLGRLEPDALSLSGVRLEVYACPGETNLPHAKAIGVTSQTKGPFNFSEHLNQLVSLLEGYVPKQLKINNLSLHLVRPEMEFNLQVDSINLGQGKLAGTFRLGKMPFSLSGTRGQNSHVLDMTLMAKDSSLVPLPWLTDRLGLSTGFKKARLTLNDVDAGRGSGDVNGTLRLEQFQFQHRRMSKKAVEIDSASLAFACHVEGSLFRIDSTSQGRLNQLPFTLYTELNLAKDTTVALRLKAAPVPANSFFASLPKAIFSSVQGMEGKGRLGYSLNLSFTTAQLDSLQFDSHLIDEHFQLTKFGTENLSRINDNFDLRTYADGQLLTVGPENPNFTPLKDMSTYVKSAILNSEDGNFYYHQGFNEEAIRKSIVENIRKHRFARGGSTISMQLVKNVFLRPEKTLGRKIEEALLVWLIEHKRLVSKERMLEVYFNVIEWGPGVYGVGSAAKFYFDMYPAQLYLNESIFLAMILPSPRAFMYYFEPDGHLKEYTYPYFKLIAGKLMAQQIITQSEYDNMDPAKLELAPAAKAYLLKEIKGNKIQLYDSLEIDDLDSLSLIGPNDPEIKTQLTQKP